MPAPTRTENTPLRALVALDRWISRHGPAGYDPYDLRGHPLFVRLTRARSLPGRALRRAAFGLAERCPVLARRAAGVEQTVNPKAMGLLAAAYARAAQGTGDATMLGKATACADWLLEHPSEGYHGLCWGYPFDWQSVVFIPRGTPSGVVSATVGDGLWLLAEATGHEGLWDACGRIGEFLATDLRRDEIDRDTLCFSYTPVDDFHVHNANLLVAEFLARVGARTRADGYVETALRAANYTLREQRPDGSFFYWGRVQDANGTGHRDCYHTGFETRALWGLWRATGDGRLRDAAVRCLDFFYRAYLREDGAVWLRPESHYPVDIHGCAEALLCPAVVRDAAPERFARIWPKVLNWVLAQMQNSDGSFAYRRYANGRIDRTPYLRWGQAWVLRALAEILAATGTAPCASA